MRDKCGGEAELLLSLLHSAASPQTEICGQSDAHCGEMKHTAGPEAPALSTHTQLLSLRDTTHRPGSCCFFTTYYRLIGSQLSERESPHWIWTLYALYFCHRGWNLCILYVWITPADSHIFRIIILNKEICWFYLWSAWPCCQMQVSRIFFITFI